MLCVYVGGGVLAAACVLFVVCMSPAACITGGVCVGGVCVVCVACVKGSACGRACGRDVMSLCGQAYNNITMLQTWIT